MVEVHDSNQSLRQKEAIRGHTRSPTSTVVPKYNYYESSNYSNITTTPLNHINGKENQHNDDDLPCQHPEEEEGEKYKFSNYIIGFRNDGFCDPQSSHKNANN